jgi:uncharacterized protein
LVGDAGKGRKLVASRLAWGVGGWLFLVLGFIGALLPLMPTTIFLILAAGCFARSSPRLEGWLSSHAAGWRLAMACSCLALDPAWSST